MRLAALEREYDPSIGRRTRLALGPYLGRFGIFGPLLLSARPDPAWSFGAKGLAALTCAGVFALSRESLQKTKLNRDLSRVVLAAFVVQALLVPPTAMLGISPSAVAAVSLSVWALFHLALALTTEWRLVVTALGFAAGALVVAVYPRLLYWSQSLSSLCAIFVVSWAWKSADSLKRAPSAGKGTTTP